MMDPFKMAQEYFSALHMADQHTKFNLQLQANKAIGDIIAQYPNIEAGLEAVAQSKWAPYAAEYINNMRQSMSALATTAKTNAEVHDGSVNTALKHLAPLYGAVQRGASNEELDAIKQSAINTALARTPKHLQDQVKAGIAATFDGILTGLPSDPEGRKVAIQQRMSNLLPSAGIGGHEYQTMIGGVPAHFDTPDAVIIGYRMPDGSFKETSRIAKGAAPGYQEPGRTLEPGKPSGPNAPTAPPPPNALTPPPAPAPAKPGANPLLPGSEDDPESSSAVPVPNMAPIPLDGSTAPPPAPAPSPFAPPPPPAAPAPTSPASTAPAPTAPAAPAAPAPEVPGYTGGPTGQGGPAAYSDGSSGGGIPPMDAGEAGGGGDSEEMASNGQPLLGDPSKWLIPGQDKGQVGTGGRWVPAQSGIEERAKNAMVHYNGEGLAAYDAAKTSKSQLDYINNALDQLAGSFFLEPGAAGQKRVDIGRGWNTFWSALENAGVKIPDKILINAEELRAAESLIKASTILQFSTVKQAFGAQREAAQTIATAGRAVPGIENTPLADKLLVESLKSQSDRVIDLRRFQSEWLADPRMHGDLTGSVEAFDKLHSPESYSQNTLRKFGLTKDGFVNQEAITTAVQNGWITPKVAAESFKRLQERETGRGR